MPRTSEIGQVTLTGVARVPDDEIGVESGCRGRKRPLGKEGLARELDLATELTGKKSHFAARKIRPKLLIMSAKRNPVSFLLISGQNSA